MATKPKPEKPKLIRIKLVKRSRRFIYVDYVQGDEELTIQSNELPLAQFSTAMDALAKVACTVVEAPAGYDLNLRVTGCKFGALRDADTIAVIVQKGVGYSGKVFSFTTPPALLQQPKTEGAVTPVLPEELVLLVQTVEEAAKDYVKGNRSQGTLPLAGDDDDGSEADEDEDKKDERNGQTKLTIVPDPAPPEPSPEPEPQPAKKARKPRKPKTPAAE